MLTPSLKLLLLCKSQQASVYTWKKAGKMVPNVPSAILRAPPHKSSADHRFVTGAGALLTHHKKYLKMQIS